MQSQNEYIGDDKFEKFLEHYECPTPLYAVRMRFIGALCSPNLELRPADVISSFWPGSQMPRLQTKDEADLFFKFFMGLWDHCFDLVQTNQVKLSKVKASSKDSFKELCIRRYEEVDMGFLEGFWGGKDDLNIPAYVAQIVDSLTDVSGIYETLLKKLDKNPDLEEISTTITHSDRIIEKAISFIIENTVLPRIDSLKREVN